MEPNLKTQISVISVVDYYELYQAGLKYAIVLDLGQAQTYSRGHLPGAVHLPVTRIVRQDGYATGLMPSKAALIELAREYGLCSGKTIYLYDDEGGGWAGRMAWILDILGVEKVVYIDGGLRAWMYAGYPLSSQREVPEASDAPEELNTYPCIQLEELQKVLAENQPLNLIDARSAGEYNGVRQFAQRAGRIPGAQHYEWTRAMRLDSDYTLRSLDVIRSELQTLYSDMNNQFVVYCQTHHRSGLSYLMCRLLGLNVRAYAGSWSEWGNNADVPIQND